MSDFRIEKDSMGEMQVPAGSYYGAQTQRAVLNFPVSGWRLPRAFVRALGLVKRSAAQTNRELGLVEARLADAIESAATEVVDGKLDDQFVVDVFQTGSGTSTNMNTNEVIANRAIEILGGVVGSKDPVHPNDHVNLCQSSNDVIPTATHVAGRIAIREQLLPPLQKLHDSLADKATAFDDIVKIGRTHLQDATPVRLGQEFRGYQTQVVHALRRARRADEALTELALGGTAVGTGINCHVEFPPKTIARISEASGIEFREAADHFEAQGARDAVVEASGQLRAIAIGLMKIANDIRLLGSGPRCGIGEIQLPAVQPGSSIMPGKVNPVICESVCQVAAQVIGCDAAIAVGGQGSYFELNVMMPMMAWNLLTSTRLLGNAADILADKCVRGIEADAERNRSLVEQSLAMCTSLAPRIGYDQAAAIAKEAYATGRTVREVAVARAVLPPDELDAVLDARKMTERGI